MLVKKSSVHMDPGSRIRAEFPQSVGPTTGKGVKMLGLVQSYYSIKVN